MVRASSQRASAPSSASVTPAATKIQKAPPKAPLRISQIVTGTAHSRARASAVGSRTTRVLRFKFYGSLAAQRPSVGGLLERQRALRQHQLQLVGIAGEAEPDDRLAAAQALDRDALHE